MSDPRAAKSILDAFFSDVQRAEPAINLVPAEVHKMMGALVALRESGLLDEQISRRWETRMRSAVEELMRSDVARAARERVEALLSEEPTTTMSPAAKREVLRPLSGIMSRLDSRRVARFDSSPDDEALIHRASGMIDALSAAGVISESERDQLSAQLNEVATREPQRPTYRVLATANSDTVEAHVTRRREPDEPTSHLRLPSGRFSGRLLKRSIAVEAPEIDGVRVLFIELHEDGTTVLFHAPWQRDASLPSVSHRVSLTDDFGTEYQYLTGRGGAFGDVMRHHIVFVPALAPEVRAIDVAVDSTVWRIPLGA
jgi:hypothetical protein